MKIIQLLPLLATGLWLAQPVLAGAPLRGLYLDKLSSILGKAAAESSVLEYCQQNRITYLAIYAGGLLDNKLDLFVQKAKASYGLTQIGLIGGSTNAFNQILSYNSSHAGKAEVINLEYEYWNHSPRDFAAFSSLLQYMRSVATPQGLMVEAYVGWPTEVEMAGIAGLVDRLLVHMYVKDPAQAFGYGRNRLLWAGEAANQVTIWPIFSTESTNHYADMPFMGDWIAAHSLDAAESIFMTDYHSETDPRLAKVTLTGFQYYSYDFMSPLLFLTATNLVPDAQTTGVPLDGKLELQIGGVTTIAAEANVTIKRALDNSIFETLTAAGGQMSVSKGTVRIAPSRPFEPETEYYVLIKPGSFANGQGASFPGITRAGAWSFTTGKTPPSLVAERTPTGIVTRWPTNAGQFKLQTTTNLAPPTMWESVVSVPEVVSGWYILSNHATDAERFYRLKSTQ